MEDTIDRYSFAVSSLEALTLIHTENMTDANDNVSTVIYLSAYAKVKLILCLPSVSLEFITNRSRKKLYLKTIS